MLDKIPGRSVFETEASTHAESRPLVSPADVIHFLLSNFLIIVACASLAGGATYLYLSTLIPVYTARAELLIDARPQQLLRELGDVGLVLDLGQIESQIAVLQSEQIALIVIKKLNLLADAEFIGPPAADGSRSIAIDPARLQGAVGAFQGGLDIRRKGVSYVIEVGYVAPNPGRAALLANATAEAFIDDQLGARAQIARSGSQWLEERIEGIRQLMNSANVKVQEFKARRDYRIIPSQEAQSDAGARERNDRQQESSTASMRSTLEELESTATTYRRLYESYLQAYTESVQRQSYPGTNARIITRATAPSRPSFPRYLRSLVAGVLVGVMIGLGIGLLRLAFGGSRH